MAKKYFIFIVFLLCLSGMSAQNHQSIRELYRSDDGQYLVDSTYIYLGNTFGNYWFNYLRNRVTERDEYGNFISASDWEYDTIALHWFEQKRYQAQYYDDKTQRLWLAHFWDEKAENWKLSDSIFSNPDGTVSVSWYLVWNPVISRFFRGKRYQNEYLENGNLLKENISRFDTLTGGWKPDVINLFEYDEGDLLTRKMIRKWCDESWTDSLQITFSYTDSNLIAMEEYQLMTGSGIWENWQRWIYSYNGTGQLREKYYSLYYADQKSWKDTRFFRYSYDTLQRLDQLLEKYWDDYENDWIDRHVTQYLFNSQGLRSEIKKQFWDPINSYWFHTDNYLYEYDEYANLIEYLHRYWDTEAGVWVNNFKENRYWSFYESQSIAEQEMTLVDVFPVPADDYLQLRFVKPVKQGTVYLHTIDGKLIRSFSLKNSEIRLDISSVSPGNYVLSIWVDGVFSAQKIIIQ